MQGSVTEMDTTLFLFLFVFFWLVKEGPNFQTSKHVYLRKIQKGRNISKAGQPIKKPYFLYTML